MLHLVLSVICLFLAPALSWAYHRYTKHYLLIDRILVIVIGLFVIKLLPDSIRAAGWLAAGLAGIGFLLPTAAERLWRRQVDQVDSLPLMLAGTGFLVHDYIDGAALRIPFETAFSQGVLWAVVLHRLPEGMIIWWVLYPKFGKQLAYLGLTAMGLSTVAGYFTGHELFWRLGQPTLVAGCFEALLAGSLAHLLTHKYHKHDEHDSHEGHDHEPKGHRH